jgi:hypothetical protein
MPPVSKTLTTDRKETFSSVALPIVTAALGFLSAAGGAWIAHRLTFLREQRKDGLAWRTKRFEQEEAAFREFLNSWNASL